MLHKYFVTYKHREYLSLSHGAQHRMGLLSRISAVACVQCNTTYSYVTIQHSSVARHTSTENICHSAMAHNTEWVCLVGSAVACV
jgi:hypothetical protein